MSVSEAQMRANHKYQTKAYFRPCVCVRREYEEALRKKAADNNETVGGYILRLIMNDINQTDVNNK